MKMILYGLKNCDTCRKATKALESAGHEVTFVDIRTEADLGTKVPLWLEAVGAGQLLNTRSATWRGLDEAARKGNPQKLLISNPTLIKRPVIEAGSAIYVSWSKAVQAALL